MHKFVTVLLLVLFIISGCKSTTQLMMEQGYRELLGDELKSMVSNVRVDSVSWEDTYLSDGTMSGKNSRGSTYSGNWKINDEGKLCISSVNQYINGCTKIFIHDKSDQIVWYEADGRKYNVKISKNN